MTDYTDLIADAREWPRDGVNEGPLINALADAIEALVQERDDLQADLDAEVAKNARYRTRNDELATVIEKAQQAG